MRLFTLKLPEAVVASPENADLSMPAFMSLLGGLAAVFAAVYFLHLEEGLNLISLLGVVVIGFGLYAFTPLAYRLPFLFLINVTALFILLGAWEGLLLLGFSLGLFAIINLPYSVRTRTVLLVFAGFLLALARLQLWPLPYADAWLPILGGLFMFRAILFLHEQRFAKEEVSIWLRLNYFFLLPNLVFVIFPVVDYKTFVQNYYRKPAYETYRKGVLRMANGVLHLFVYRLIYYYLIPNPTDIQDIYGWLQFIVTSYALIMRLAGIFHFSAGVICLFGFDLPPTFNHYFFADSFSDLWRRINMYWRDFVMKVFYYPIYFKVKHLGTVNAIAISIMITFVFNWFLHAYQWFWIRGAFLFTLQDVSFWAVFGVAVTLNSVYQARQPRKKKGKAHFQLLGAGLLSLRVIGIFFFMAFLWSWWTAPSITAWWGLLGVWQTVQPADALVLAGGLVGLVISGIAIQYVRYIYESRNTTSKVGQPAVYAMSLTALGCLALIGWSPITTQISTRLGMDFGPVLTTQLNAADREAQFQGYYETMLAGTNLMTTPLDEITAERPDNWLQLHTLDALIRTNDLITKKLKPNLDLVFKGARFQTNDLGLRDRPVVLARAPGTLRMALLGGSIEMGTGVTTEQTYDNLVEDELTKKHLFQPFERVEIVNFGVSGIHLPQHLARVDKVVPDFQPQVVIYTAHSDEIRRIMANLYRVYADSLTVEYEYLNTLFTSLDLPRTVDEATFKRALRPRMMDVIAWGLMHIQQQTEAMGALPVWMFVPSLDGKYTPEEDEALYQQAQKLGFYVLDLRNFNGETPEDQLILGTWDRHPNARGHALLAKKMVQQIRQNTTLVKNISAIYDEQ